MNYKSNVDSYEFDEEIYSRNGIISDELKDNSDIIKAMLRYDNSFFDYASDRLKDDKNFYFELLEIKDYGYLYTYLSDRLKNDKEVVLTALKKDNEDYSILDDIPASLKEDKDVKELIEKVGLDI